MTGVPCTVLMIHDGASAYGEIARRQASVAGFQIVDLNDLSEFGDDDWRSFERHYRHTSTNSILFEKACFKRYFRAREYVNRMGIDEFVMIDTDLMLFPSALNAGNEIFSIMRAKRNLAVVSVCVGHADYWHASPHCSFWTRHGLNCFVAYLRRIVEEEKLLSAIEADGRRHPNYTGFSDMIALGAWMKEDERVFDILTLEEEGLWDHNVTLGWQGERKFLNVFGSKLLGSIEGQPCVFEIGAGWTTNRVRVHSLHMQGRAKVAMQSVQQGKFTIASILLMLLAGLKFSRRVWRNITRSRPLKSSLQS